MKLIVSVHDVAPPFELEIRRQITLLRAAGVDRFVLKVVPNWHGEHSLRDALTLVELLHEESARGSQLVLHGFEHRRRGPLRGSLARRVRASMFAGDAPEFMSLPPREAAYSLRAALDLFHACKLPPPSTFCPPGWLIDAEATRLLPTVGIKRMVTMFALHDLTTGRQQRFAGLGYMGAGTWQEAGVRALNALVDLTWTPRAQTLRIFLHPQNTPSTAIDSVMARIKALVSAGREPVTFDGL